MTHILAENTNTSRKRRPTISLQNLLFLKSFLASISFNSACTCARTEKSWFSPGSENDACGVAVVSNRSASPIVMLASKHHSWSGTWTAQQRIKVDLTSTHHQRRLSQSGQRRRIVTREK